LKVHYDACPLGHSRLETTTRYAHVSTEVIAGTASPLDKLSLSVTPPR
jgi:integrase/recombinase XerD